MDGVINLINATYAKNSYGVQKPTETSREVFAEVRSVTRSEFYQAGRNGLNPQYVFSVFAGDYGGETICEFDGNRYAIYRAYRADSDYIELYAERQGGTNAAHPPTPKKGETENEDSD